MENHTEGLPLYKWAERKTCEELANTDWLQKMAAETSTTELEKYNPAITSFVKLIEDLEKKPETVKIKKEIEYFKKVLKREKIMAIIHRDEKEAKKVA